MSLSRHLFIAGEAAPDLFCFHTSTPLTSAERSVHTEWFRGGAGLLAHLLGSLAQANPKVNVHAPEFPDTQVIPSSLIELSQRFDTEVFTVDQVKKLGIDSELHLPKSLPPPGSANDRTLYIFQDGENHFASKEGGEEGASNLHEPHRASYFLYHMSRPLCKGAVWEKVRPKALPDTQDRLDPDRLVVIVQADDIRAEGVELSQGSSWEKTCEDFVRNIGAVGSLVTLVTCPHLIVVFGCDGIVYHRGLDVLKPVLFFDPLRTEDEFFKQNVKYVPGVMEAFVAGFAKALVQSDEVVYEDCIKAGFKTSRRLARKGISSPGPNGSLYDVPAIMEAKEVNDDALIRFDIPSDEIGKGEQNWSLLDFVIADSAEVARRIVLEGISNINIPLSRIKKLVLFDRKEIQLFHTLKSHLTEYLAVPQVKPLSIALFGPRGSGKTFAALQVTEAAAAGKRVRPLVFDLSEFKKLEDLAEAFHQIRDCALDGYVACAYFKNFDVSFLGDPFGWLPHLLPAMINGRFFDGPVSRPTGGALLFFGASATKTFAAFRRHAEKSNTRAVQEFIGCLQGFVDVAGFNRGGVGDKLYPFRRAVVLRALLEERAPKLKSGDGIRIDESVLSGLLLVSEYFQGIRSLKSVLAMSHLHNALHFSRSALPSETQLQLHVDYGQFVKAMSGKLLPTEVRELLAERLNDAYNNHTREKARAKPGNELKTDEEIDNENWVTPWNKLKEIFKDSNRDHADAIPSTIRRVSCFLAEKKDGREPVTEFSREEIEIMSIHEKGRWNSERLQRQWKTGPRSGEARTTPYLVPWEDLEEDVKEIDRTMVRAYLRILPPNYAIYRMDSRASANG